MGTSNTNPTEYIAAVDSAGTIYNDTNKEVNANNTAVQNTAVNTWIIYRV